MHVVVAPDSFSGTLTAVEAAQAIADGWRRARPGDQLTLVPMADGGQGLLEVVAHAHHDAARHHVEVADARGIARMASWLELPDGVAVVEVAQAVGLFDIPEEDRDPLKGTSYGVGQLLNAVLAHPVTRVVVGLGGSATVDGGAGMISALTGHALRRADGNGVKVGGRWVAQAAHLAPFELAAMPPVTIASDVTNPLLGPDGAARVFGPQKGAGPDAVDELEVALGRLADVLERDLPGGPWRDLPGAGAAGGLGFALMALLQGEMASGARVVAELVGFHVTTADLVITGEGCLDAQTASGKAPAFVLSEARRHGTSCYVIAGRIENGAGAPFDAAEALGDQGLIAPAATLADAAARLARRTD